MTWTDARIAQLTNLWNTGVSASGIAEVLGDVSRSAVLGKLHRLRLLRTRKAASPPRRYEGACGSATPLPARPAPPRPPPAPSGPPEPPSSPWREEAFAPLAGTRPRPWLSRGAGECAFPVGGEGERVLACCAPAQAKSAYCAVHHQIVFKPQRAQAKAAATPAGEATLETSRRRKAA